MSYVLFYGYHKDHSPMWEGKDHIGPHGDLLEEPSDPNDPRVIKFETEEAAMEYQAKHYHLGAESYEVLPLDTASEIYHDYTIYQNMAKQ